jgi:hypothetical protein
VLLGVIIFQLCRVLDSLRAQIAGMNHKEFAYGLASHTAPISDLEFLGATSGSSAALPHFDAIRGQAGFSATGASSLLETDAMTALTPEERAAIVERLAEIVATLDSDEPISILKWVKLFREKRKLERKLAKDVRL